MSRIVAIDPGNASSAWCVLDGERVLGFAKEPNSEVLIRCRREWSPLDARGCDLLAVEMVQSFGMPVGREVFETVLWTGRYIEAWERRQGKFQLVYRKDVKLYLCQSMRAKDSNIRAALLDRFGPGREKAIGNKRQPGPLYGLSGDCWSALAVGLTAGLTAAHNACDNALELAA